ncbi:MAG: four helix bundle protein [Opitutaceae bacterium]
MPAYSRFEDLPVWQAAASLYEKMDTLLSTLPTRTSSSFRDQLERAALSVSNNIAEGFERGTTNELLAFLYIARGSAGEVRSMLRLLARRATVLSEQSSAGAQISDFKSQISEPPKRLRDDPI